jgi:hypothetical protein
MMHKQLEETSIAWISLAIGDEGIPSRSYSPATPAAISAIAADFNARDHNVEFATLSDLVLELLKQYALELRYLPAPQTGHVEMVTANTALIEMALAFHVHEVEFVHHTLSLEQSKCAIDSDPINPRIDLLRFAQDLWGIEMSIGSFNDADDNTTLAGDSDSARCKIGE